MAILLCRKPPLRPPPSVMSVPAAAGLWRCASRFAGGFIFAGGGCGNAANGPNIFWNQGLSGADIGAQPRTAGNVVRRVFRHLHRNVPVPGRFALDHVAMSALAAGFLVRIFIIQHDCGHGSYFRSRRANELIGRLCSLMTLTPYAFWRRQHARHHGSWNNLDRRAASGLDIYSSCMTVAEYRALGRWRRCLVRLTNHPIVANLLLPPLVFVILYRVPFDAAKGWRRERLGVYLTNLALAGFMGGLS